MSKFFTFSQNNSGGSFVLDKDTGLTHYVIIEANTPDQASARAQDIGIYFDGVAEGVDCGCCGDRWYEPWNADGDDKPTLYGKSPEEHITGYGSLWMEKGYNVCTHYLDGRMEWL